MKARKRNSNDEWKEIKYVQLEDSDILYKEEYIEFQHDNLSTELKTFDQTDEKKHWQDVREKSAIAAMQSIIPTQDGRYSLCDEYLRYGDCAEESIKYADALIEQLKTK